MTSLSETNKYLRDKKKRKMTVLKNTLASSVVEGESRDAILRKHHELSLSPDIKADSKKSDKGS